MNQKHKIYLDYAATTPVSKEVLEAMLPYFSHYYGNASELHDWGKATRLAIEKARQQVSEVLGSKNEEIVFTSCATESINLAHKGLLEALLREFPISNFQFPKKMHVITSSIEHKAVLETCAHLEKLGWAEVTYLPVDKNGLVAVSNVEVAIRPETVLVSIMYVNNEVGTIEPIAEIGKLIKKVNLSRLSSHLSRIYFHTDATQGIQYLDCQVDDLGVDLLSFTGHKFYTPKGVGALYVRQGTPLTRQQDGGGQENKKRSGTENVPYVVGLGKAMEIVSDNRQQTTEEMRELRDKLISGVLQIPGVELTGHPTQRAPHIASFIVKGVEGESLLLLLNEEGIAVSTGSACTTGNLQPSHVLTAMGYRPESSHGSIRFSLGKDTTREEIELVLKIFPMVVEKLRMMAPDLKKGEITLSHAH